jgi:uncharacterized protein
LPVSVRDHQYHLDSAKGKTIDYAVQLKKLDTSRQMNLLLKKNKVTKEHIRKIASTISRFHKNIPATYPSFSRKNAEADFNDILTVKKFLDKHLDKKTSGKITDAIRKSNTFLKKNEGLFRKREAQGFVRDCHGDMHSRNIFLYHKPVIFDCIEFNKKYRHIDVLKEIAFLCMDLEAYKKYGLSDYLLRTYSGNSLNDELYFLFTYYKAFLANVKAKVNALNAMQQAGNDACRQSLQESLKYIDLMHSYISLL